MKPEEIMLCKNGEHDFRGRVTFSIPGVSSIMGGRKCIRCQVGEITIEEARELVLVAHNRGRLDSCPEYAEALKKELP